MVVRVTLFWYIMFNVLANFRDKCSVISKSAQQYSAASALSFSLLVPKG